MRFFPPTRHPSFRRLAALLAICALTFVACGADRAQSSIGVFDTASDASDDTADTAGDAGGRLDVEMDMDEATMDNAAMDEMEMEEMEMERAGLGDSAAAEPVSATTTAGSTGGQGAPTPADLGRDIIFTAHLEIGATDVTASSANALRTIEGLGGFLFSQQTQGGVAATSTMVFKISPEQFQTALDRLGAIGDVRSQSVSADDVTSIVVDLQSRISTAEASVIRLRELLEGADLTTIITLETQLLERETTLERLRGQLRSLRNQTDLATISVQFFEIQNRPGLNLGVGVYHGHDSGFGCADFIGARAGGLESEDPFTVCHAVSNVGDTTLVDIDIVDDAFTAADSEAFVVEGSLSRLEPGEFVIVAREVEADDALRIRSSASATALDDDGDQLPEPVETKAAPVRIDVESTGFPSLGDVFSKSITALGRVINIAAIAVVAVLPFAVMAALIAVFGLPLWRRWRGKAASKVDNSAANPTPPMPPRPGDLPEPPGPAAAATPADKTTVTPES